MKAGGTRHQCRTCRIAGCAHSAHGTLTAATRPIKTWFAAPSPHTKNRRASRACVGRRTHDCAARSASARKSAFSVYTRCTFASPHTLGATANSSAPVAAPIAGTQ